MNLSASLSSLFTEPTPQKPPVAPLIESPEDAKSLRAQASKGVIGSRGLLKMIEYGQITKQELFAPPAYIFTGGKGTEMAKKSEALWKKAVEQLPDDEILSKKDYKPNYGAVVSLWKKLFKQDNDLKAIDLESKDAKDTIAQHVAKKVKDSEALLKLASARAKAVGESAGYSQEDLVAICILEHVLRTPADFERTTSTLLKESFKDSVKAELTDKGTMLIESNGHKFAVAILEMDGSVTDYGARAIGEYIQNDGLTSKSNGDDVDGAIEGKSMGREKAIDLLMHDGSVFGTAA